VGVALLFDVTFSLIATCDPVNQQYQGNHAPNEYCSPFRGPFVGITVAAIKWIVGIISNPQAITALATVAIALFTLTLWRTSSRQATITREAVETAEAANDLNRQNAIASRRAWLAIKDVKLKHPTQFTEELIVYGTKVTIKNLGQTPAKSVWIHLESYYAKDNQERFVDAEARFLRVMRQHPVQLGDTLFPQDALTQTDRWRDAREKIERAIGTRPSGERKVEFVIFIGISYRIVGDPDAHITYLPYSMLNVPIGTELAEGQLVDLPRMAFTSGDGHKKLPAGVNSS
jgi:hypothetical protein